MNTNTVTKEVAYGHELYFDSSTAMLRFDDHCARLDHKTFQLLCYFVAHQDQIIERRALMAHLWQNQHASDASLGRLISVLRKILGVHGHKFIFTIHKTGYRFVVPQEVQFIDANPTVREMTVVNNVHPIDTKPSQPATEPKEPAVISEVEKVENTQRLPWLLISCMILTTLSLLMAIYLWHSSIPIEPIEQTKPDAATSLAQINSPDVERLAILPFEPLSSHLDDGMFVAGLTAELLDSLTKIKGLRVVDRHHSFKFTSERLNSVEVAKELNVRYLLKGNVRKQQQQFRVNVQLIDSLNDNTLYSSVYELQQNASFATQIEIAAQMAAVMRLTLYHQPQGGHSNFNSALAELPPQVVEQLVLTREQINHSRKIPLSQTIERLEERLANYPHSPQILGLLAYAHAVQVKVSPYKEEYDRSTERDLALKALSLDKTNYDALFTLYYYYRDFAEFNGQAELVAEDIGRYYPNAKAGFEIGLNQQIEEQVSCQKLRAVVNQVPAGIYSAQQTQALQQVADSCSSPELMSTAEDLKLINQASYQLGLKSDGYYQALHQYAQRTPDQQYVSELYCRQLDMGAVKMANVSLKRLGELVPGYWPFFAALCSYTNGADSGFIPSQHLDFSRKMINDNMVFELTVALVKQFQQAQTDKNTLSKLLAQMPAIQIDTQNKEKALGLMMLQYYSDNKALSFNTARQLLYSLNQYQKDHPDAYGFWSLAAVHFATAFYANDLDKAEQILNQGFESDETYWMHSRAVMQVVLAPWLQHPLVQTYLQRIYTDADRARLKFGLY